jgi:hypothetical protein
MGHEISGEVAAAGEGVTHVSAGQPVAIEPVEVCRSCVYCYTGRAQLCPERKLLGTMLPGAFAGYILVPSHIVHPLPDGVDVEAGALVEPLAVSVHGLRQVALEFGERVVVLGAGSIGLLAVVAARALGAKEVFATARYPHQADMARARRDAVAQASDAVDSCSARWAARAGGRRDRRRRRKFERSDRAQSAAAFVTGHFLEPAAGQRDARRAQRRWPDRRHHVPSAAAPTSVALGITRRHADDMRGDAHRVAPRTSPAATNRRDKSQRSIK